MAEHSGNGEFEMNELPTGHYHGIEVESETNELPSGNAHAQAHEDHRPRHPHGTGTYSFVMRVNRPAANFSENVAHPPATIDPQQDRARPRVLYMGYDPADNLDPLNWLRGRKYLFLATICFMSFLTDFLSGYGVPMMLPQSQEWGVSLIDVTRSLTGNTFTQGLGSVLTIPFAQRYGVLPVMFWCTSMTLMFTILCAVSPNWIGSIAIRVLQGFFSSAPQVLGLTIIQEMFIFEEHARMIGIWGWSVLIGPYFGPFMGSFILKALTWRQAWWVAVGLVAFGLLLVILILEETGYDRVNRFNNPLHPGGYFEDKVFTLSGMMGYEAGGRKKFFQAVHDIWLVFRQPQFVLLFIYHGTTYMWTVGLNGTLISYLVPTVSKGGYGFDTVGLGLIYFAPIVAIILGELFGHFFNEALQNRSIRRNQGIFKPEDRLWGLYHASPLMTLGLILVGFSLERHWHWSVVAVTWGLFVFAAMTSTVVISAYVLDCFPEQSAITAALLNFSRVFFGFLAPIFQKTWSNKVGADWSFTTQGFICLLALLLVITVQRFGKNWRTKGEMGPSMIMLQHGATAR
ncbi:major facilitator superfamily domain-containing protein [Tricharina praecox]|uniref:major facilitator superfamily domain-containing protein n=1 Tax=Tricharina praecox TaxID=43433 RepID=UPI00221F6102|nr:major facilitator superfamily domain-containing protein [Tricharina praecox]KAI5849177.1 major facilitator superfamily domain-containing protein [Tricharina praecox]